MPFSPVTGILVSNQLISLASREIRTENGTVLNGNWAFPIN
jgi:hypothetical protein